MDGQVMKRSVFEKASAGAAAIWDLAAAYVPRLARHTGTVAVFLDGAAMSVVVARPVNRHSRIETSTVVMLEQDASADPTAAALALTRVLEGVKRPPRTLVVAVGAELTFERRIVLPAMTPAETDGAVDFQADRVLPFPSGEMGVDYAVDFTAADGIQSIVISAVTRETLAKIEAMAQAAGLALAAVFSAPSALYAVLAAGDRTAGLPMAVIHRRLGGMEIAVGVSAAAGMSRFSKNYMPSSAAAELDRTASGAGIDLSRGARVFVPREIAESFSADGRPLDIRPLEAAIASLAGAPQEDGACAAVAAATAYIRGIPVPNFYAPAAAMRRRQSSRARHGRVRRWAAVAGVVVGVLALSFAGLWFYALALDAKAARLASANASLKAAVNRADVARPWLTQRTNLLDVLAGTTEAFPGSGGAFVKSLSVTETGKVSFQGRVGNPQSAYDLVTGLSKVKGFRDVKLESGAADSSGGYSFTVSFEAENWRVSK